MQFFLLQMYLKLLLMPPYSLKYKDYIFIKFYKECNNHILIMPLVVILCKYRNKLPKEVKWSRCTNCKSFWNGNYNHISQTLLSCTMTMWGLNISVLPGSQGNQSQCENGWWVQRVIWLVTTAAAAAMGYPTRPRGLRLMDTPMMRCTMGWGGGTGV